MVTLLVDGVLTLNIWVESFSSIPWPPVGFVLVAVPHTLLPSSVTATCGVLLTYSQLGLSTVMALNSLIWLLPSMPMNTLLKLNTGVGVVDPVFTNVMVNTA